MKKIFIFLITILTILTLVGCQNFISTPTLDKRALKQSYDKLFIKRSQVLVYDDPKLVPSGISFITSEFNKKLNSALREAVDVLYSKENITKERIDSTNKLLESLNKNFKISRGTNLNLSNLENKYLFDLLKFEIDLNKYPKEFIDFYYECLDSYRAKINFNDNRNFVSSLLSVKNEILKLIQIMDLELESNLEKTIEYVKNNIQNNSIFLYNNPFKSLRPRIVIKKSPEDIIYQTTKQINRLLEGVKAFDFLGNDISVFVYLQQNLDIHQEGMYYVQLTVTDKYNNTTVDKNVFKVKVSNERIAPIISEPQIKNEIFGYGKAQTIDFRNLITAKNYLNINIEKKYITTKIYDAKGELVNLNNELDLVMEPQNLPNIENKKIKFWSLKPEGQKPFTFNFPLEEDISLYAVLVEDEKYKPIINPVNISFDLSGSTDILPNLVLERGQKMRKVPNPRKKGYIFKYWENNGKEFDFTQNIEKDINLKAVWQENANENNIELKTVKYYVNGELYQKLTIEKNQKREAGYYKIVYQAVDPLNNMYSNIINKEITILPESVPNFSNTSESNNVLPDFKFFDIKNLKNWSEKDEDKYYYNGLYPLINSKKTKAINKNYKENQSKLILFDEVTQFINGEEKLIGFNNMTYDLMPYIDMIVTISPNSNIIVPTKKVINMFHKNGIKVFGHINIPYEYEGGNKKDLIDLINLENIEKLVKMAEVYGFDGWAINIKTGFIEYKSEEVLNLLPIEEQAEYLERLKNSKKQMDELVIPFLKKFYQKMNEKRLEVIYEGGLHEKGYINRSVELKESNKIFFGEQNNKISDYYILGHDNRNNDILLNESLDIVQKINRNKFDLFQGFTLQESLNKQGIGFFGEIFSNKDIRNGQIEISTALYNLNKKVFDIKTSNMNYFNVPANDPLNNVGANDYYSYIKKIEKFINGGYDVSESNIMDYLNIPEIDNKNRNEKATELEKYFNLATFFNTKTIINENTFLTSFNTGNGKYYFEEGIKIADFTSTETWDGLKGYSNLEIQDLLPTWRWNKQLLNESSQSKKMEVGFYHDDAYNGLSSLKIQGKFNKKDNFDLMLYKTDIELDDSQIFSIYLKSGLHVKVSLVLTIDKDNNYYNKKVFSLNGSHQNNQWIKYSTNLNKSDVENQKITSIGLRFETEEENDINLDILLGQIRLASLNEQQLKFPINNFKILDRPLKYLGFDYGNQANAVVTFDLIEQNNKILYKIYQKHNDKLIYLESSYNNVIGLKKITRFANNPVNPKFPTKEEYDKKAILVVKAFDENLNYVGKSELEFQWEQELIKGGKAQLKFSSKIAMPNEIILISPVLSKMTESYQLEIKTDPNNYKLEKLSNGSFAVVFYKEGFYTLEYKTINPYGEEILKMENAIIISNVIPKESDLTKDAIIDDSTSQKGIKYSSYVNKGERPSLLFDTYENGEPNLHTKWCSSDKGPGERWVIIDFVDFVYVKRFVFHHSASSKSNAFDIAGGKDFNTIEYNIYGSEDEETWILLVHRENNHETVTQDILDEAVKVKHLKLEVVNGGSDITARIYDMRIYGSR